MQKALPSLVLVLGLALSLTRAADAVLPGTAPLTQEAPLDEVMVAGIDRFARRELAASPRRREEFWPRASATAADEASRRQGLRQRLAAIIGAVDPRVPATDFQLIATLGHPATIAESDNFTVLAVRWSVLEGVTGEGLLLQPRSAPALRAVVLPDADWTPEDFVGLGDAVPASAQLPRRLAAHGCQVLVPMILSRRDEFSGHARVRFTNQTHREFIYRQAFEVGRHVIGYEVQKILAAIDLFTAANTRERRALPLAVGGVGEGGLLALYAAALDERIGRTLVSGYFQAREGVWQEPIYRNVWGLLTRFGDAELAGLVAPRTLCVEACAAPEAAGPPPVRPDRRGAAPGRLATPVLASVQREYARAREIFTRSGAADRLALGVSDAGRGPAGTTAALAALLDRPPDTAADSTPVRPIAPAAAAASDASARERRQFLELQEHVQRLARLSHQGRDALWSSLDRSSPARWTTAAGPLRDRFYDEVIGRLPAPTLPPHPRTRRVTSAPWLEGHADTFDAYEVVLDVYEDVIAAGLLLLPRDLQPGERRPVVVVQHGLEGLAADVVAGPASPAFRAYKSFGAELCRRGFIVYSPQNPYRGGDRFRTLQRQSNVLQRSLYSYIIPQHQRTLEWLATLPQVDPARIAFYGLSYGGKTAMRVPPFVAGYSAVICSGDFNEWIKKITTVEERPGYIYSGEYEIFEWNMAHVANYAELASLLTPRPFMVERGHDDGVALDEWVAWEFAKVRRHYAKLGLGDRVELEFFNGPHTIHGQGTYRFLHRHLAWPERR